MQKKYTEQRILLADDLRAACIRHEWYTEGTCAEYEALFRKLRDRKTGKLLTMTTARLAAIAEDILAHTTRDILDTETVMFILNREACLTQFREV